MSADPIRVIRADIRKLAAYPVQHGQGMIKLDAMENPHPLPQWLRQEIAGVVQHAELNRYPDPEAPALKSRLRALMRVPEGSELILGNGSDEIIAMLINAVAGPEVVIMAVAPTFVMFKMSSVIARARFESVSVNADFSLDADRVIAAMQEHRPAIVFIAYPNNPTGYLYSEPSLLRILEHAPGLIVIDEAYQVFAGHSFMSRLNDYPNLVVMRTLSKLGLAGLRLGYAAATPELIREIDKVRGPYNVGVLTQLVAERILEHHEVLENQAREIVAERTRLDGVFRSMPGVTVFPSAANFLLTRVHDANNVYSGLKERRILIRNLHGSHPLLSQCIRFTVGTKEENDLVIAALADTLSTAG